MAITHSVNEKRQQTERRYWYVCMGGLCIIRLLYYKGSQGVPRMRNVREWWNLPNQPRNRFFPYSPQMFQSLFRTWNSSVFMLHFTFSEKTESGPVIPKLHSLAINNINSWLNRFLKLCQSCNSYNKINGFLNLCPPAWKLIYQNKWLFKLMSTYLRFIYQNLLI